MKTAVLVLAVLVIATSARAQNNASRPYGISVDYVGLSTAEQWRQADAVVRLRISDTKPLGSGWAGLDVQHTANVITVLKTHPVGGPSGQRVTFVQSGSTGEPPYAEGDEFIAFLRWSGAQFTRLAGPQSLCSVRDGRVTWRNEPEPTLAHLGETPPPTLETLTVEDFIARLRALGKESR
jgi:hypothetical protein